MKLNDYLRADGSLTVTQLRTAIGAKSDAQIRQWQHGYDERLPSPENCVAIEGATARAVMRWDLRPDDWHRIWPELIGAEGAPIVALDHQSVMDHASRQCAGTHQQENRDAA